MLKLYIAFCAMVIAGLVYANATGLALGSINTTTVRTGAAPGLSHK
ncbi:MAG: hypothetical protein OJI70_15005 [Zavarzinia sp.]|nr:hypothetical protein [Zavarzinia sp.]